MSPLRPTVLLSAPEAPELPLPFLESAVRLVLDREGVAEGEFSLAFLPDEAILALNRRWLEHDWVPDVLAFALHDAGEPPIGDIYVGAEQAARQAREHGVPLHEELARLAIHGTLHVLGYDHGEEAEGGPAAADGSAEPSLFRLQEELLREVLAQAEPGGAGELERGQPREAKPTGSRIARGAEPPAANPDRPGPDPRDPRARGGPR